MYKITKGLSFLPTQTLDISMLFSLQLLNMLNMLKLFNLVLVLLKVTNILYQFVSQYFPGFFLVIVIISFPQIICVDLQRVVGRFNPLKPGLQSRALCVYFINSWSTLLNWPIASLLIFFFLILFSSVFFVHNYNLCFIGSPCYSISCYNYNSIWPYYSYSLYSII